MDNYLTGLYSLTTTRLYLLRILNHLFRDWIQQKRLHMDTILKVKS